MSAMTQTEPSVPAKSQRRSWFLIGIRYVLPAVVIVGGVVPLLLNPSETNLEGFAHLMGAGLAVLLLNVLHRVGVSGEQDRYDEDAARDYFDRHGHWPDEAPDRA